MAEATSPTTGRRHGVAGVCRVWDVPRSSFYAAQGAETDSYAAQGAETDGAATADRKSVV